MVKVKVLAIDDRGKIKLSMRAVDQVTGEPLEVQPRPPRGDGPRPPATAASEGIAASVARAASPPARAGRVSVWAGHG